MQEMNKVMDPQKTAKMMQEFERENAKMGMTEEMSKCTYIQYPYIVGKYKIYLHEFEIQVEK